MFYKITKALYFVENTVIKIREWFVARNKITKIYNFKNYIKNYTKNKIFGLAVECNI